MKTTLWGCLYHDACQAARAALLELENWVVTVQHAVEGVVVDQAVVQEEAVVVEEVALADRAAEKR